MIIHYANGSTDVIPKATFREAHDYCRNNISYSAGRVRRVEIETEPGSLRAMWDASWDDESKDAGLQWRA